MTRVRVLQRHKLQFGHTPCRTAPYIAVQTYTLSYSSLHRSSGIHPVVQLLASQFRHTPCRTAPCITVQTYTLSYSSLHRSSDIIHPVVRLLASQFVQLLASQFGHTPCRTAPCIAVRTAPCIACSWDTRPRLPPAASSRCGRCCNCLLYTSPSPRDGLLSRMPSSA